MNCSSTFRILGVAALVSVAGSLAFAQQPPKDKPAPPKAPGATTPSPGAGAGVADQQPQLPPGWTEADMQACMEAGTPGPMHAHLAESIGVWKGKTTMWMAPGAEPIKSECTSTITAMMDGRFIKCETAGDMPGMGPFNGFGLYGFDNVSEKFQSTWIDNCGTGMMVGTGELSSDGDTLTWTYTYNCPITKKPVKMREVDRRTGKDTSTLEMYNTDPKSGKEYKMMEIALTRVPGSAKSASAAGKAPGGKPGAAPEGAVLMIVDRTVDAGCGNCVYHMSGVQGCKLAVKVDGTTYLVKGADTVNAHQFCSGAKPVLVSGRIVDDTFIASEFEVKP
jgi:hypothetical protein